MDKYTVNHQYFGHTLFREGQEQLIDSILARQDSFGIMPTGGGKSVCYQIPALLLPGLTLVISPLISLMKDQVSALHDAGISAAYWNSSMDLQEFQWVRDGVRAGEYKLLYIAPERLDNDAFLALMQTQEVSLVAVDEAHCVSQWGQDFRPSYLKIADFVAALPKRPVVAAFTATATEEVREDIIRCLRLEKPNILVTGFDRPNLHFSVQSHKDKSAALLNLVRERSDRCGIVYCATRSKVEQLCDMLNHAGIPATRYHAGLSDEERRANQDEFQFDRKSVMVATNAFGMGIDKSNVSFVIHYNMPKSLEAYYQEAGRAGRDGMPADCILLYSGGDVVTARHLIDHSGDTAGLSGAARAAVRARDLHRLDRMIGYCKTTGCLRSYLLDYFGQSHPDTCNNCGNCQSAYEALDMTTQAQMIFSCILRVKARLGYFVGSGLIINVLRGSKSQRLHTLGLDTLSTYGLLRSNSRASVQDYLDRLTELGYLFTEPEHRTLRVTAKADEVLHRGIPVTLSRKIQTPPPQAGSLSAPDGEGDTALLSTLKAVRSKLAQQENIPAYIVFSNATLQDMVRKKPRTMLEFLQVSGVGEVKAARYGDIFLDALNNE